VLAQRYGAVPERPDGAARSLLGDTRTSIVLRESTPPQTSSSATAPVIAAMQLKLQMAIASFGPVTGTNVVANLPNEPSRRTPRPLFSQAGIRVDEQVAVCTRG
jgi:hypothetical protein